MSRLKSKRASRSWEYIKLIKRRTFTLHRDQRTNDSNLKLGRRIGYHDGSKHPREILVRRTSSFTLVRNLDLSRGCNCFKKWTLLSSTQLLSTINGSFPRKEKSQPARSRVSLEKEKSMSTGPLTGKGRKNYNVQQRGCWGKQVLLLFYCYGEQQSTGGGL
jgi:hypothetical protein